ncbi:MAG: hypothetical protein CMN30_09910 [Sandaracinus sp.]|nr:hypothetical protein [Sandaracinus sp.]
MAPRLLPSLLLFVASALACGGPAGSYDGTVYRGPETGFTLPQPGNGWERVDVEESNDLAWANDGAVIQVNASCDPGLDIPLEALTAHLMIGFTERNLVSQERVPMAGREALRTHVQAKLDGVPRELVLVVLKKNECVYDFAAVAPPGSSFERTQPVFDGMLARFETR